MESQYLKYMKSRQSKKSKTFFCCRSLKKEYFQGFISNQMSSDVYEDVKVSKLRPKTQADGTEMVSERPRSRWECQIAVIYSMLLAESANYKVQPSVQFLGADVPSPA